MYEAFYGFKEKPFAITPDPRYLYLSRSHRDALNHLQYGITEGEGFMVVAGQIGLGKTTISRALVDRLPPGMRTAMVINPLLSETELVEIILDEFQAPPADRSPSGKRSFKELLDALNGFLLELSSKGLKAVLIFDEAQNLSLSVLERIRLLSNLETGTTKLLQIILVGQLELLKKLSQPELAQLNQRVSVRYALLPLKKEELAGYISHRIRVAGAQSEVVFRGDALRAIYRFSSGVPRLINLACDRALLAGFEEESTRITQKMVERGIQSLGESGLCRTQRPVRKWRLTGAYLGGGLVLLLAVGLLGLLGIFSGRSGLHPRADSPAGAGDAGISRGHTQEPAQGVGQASRYVIALESYATAVEPSAQRRVQQLRDLGYQTYLGRVTLPGQSASLTVFVSGYQNEEEMKAALERLKTIDSFPDARLIAMP